MMYTMPKNLLSICVNFTLATQLPEAEQRKDRRPSCLFQIQSAASSQMELSESAAV